MVSQIREDYANWLIDLSCKWCREYGSYRKLMGLLHSVPFTVIVQNDSNRAADGLDLRMDFVSMTKNYTSRDMMIFMGNTPCSMLEMMMGLARRCEDHVMGDPDVGDETGRWFFGMIKNMHLDRSTDDIFDEEFAEEAIYKVIDRRYAKNGDGGLFSVKNKSLDMRQAEIWYQLMWYLNEAIKH